MCARQARILLVVIVLLFCDHITAYLLCVHCIFTVYLTVYSLRIYACVYVFTEKREFVLQ